MGTDQPSRIRSLLLVIGVSLGSAALITGTYEFSFERILANEHARVIENLSSVINPRTDAPPDALEIDLDALPEDDYIRQIFAMLDSAGLNAWVYSAVAPSGYNGPIEFLAGLTPDGQIVRIRVVQHRETPGLGDAIEDGKSDWARQFDSASLGNPAMWALESAGGTFDGLTGATVTPRATIEAIEGVLQYHAVHAGSLLDALEAQRQTEAMRGQ